MVLLAFVGLLFTTGSFAANTSFSLAGNHYNITMVHCPPFVDMGLSDGDILPSSEWSGYVVDMVRMLSREEYAHFDYTLLSPSGEGTSCGSSEAAWPYQYICGEEDVYELNSSAMYWSNYYVTASRMLDGTAFTLPFMTNQKLTILVLAEEPSFYDDAVKMLAPFSTNLWICLGFSILFAALVGFVTEHLHDPRAGSNVMMRKFDKLSSLKEVSVDEVESIIREYDDNRPEGLLGPHSLFHTLPRFLISSCMTITTHGDGGIALAEEGGTANQSNLLFTAAWCCLAILLISGYTANLAAILTTEEMSAPVTSLDDMERLRLPVCSYDSAAYTIFLETAYPKLEVVYGLGLTDMLEDLVAGRCHALLEAVSTVELLVNGKIDLDAGSAQKYCYDDVTLYQGDAMKFGFTDFAVGVREDLPDLRRVLSYWIAVLTQCHPNKGNSVCYVTEPATNINLLYEDVYLGTPSCGSNIAIDDYTLTPAHFFFPMCFVAVLGVFLFGYHAFKLLRLWVLETNGGKDDLDDFLRGNSRFKHCWELLEKGSQRRNLNGIEAEHRIDCEKKVILYVGRVIATVDTKPINTAFLKKVTGSLGRHFISHDIKSYFLLKRVERKVQEIASEGPSVGRQKYLYHHCILMTLLKIALSQLYSDTSKSNVVLVMQESSQVRLDEKYNERNVRFADTPSLGVNEIFDDDSD